MHTFSIRTVLAASALTAALTAAPAVSAMGEYEPHPSHFKHKYKPHKPHKPHAVPELDGRQAGLAGALLVGAFLLLAARPRQDRTQAASPAQ